MTDFEKQADQITVEMCLWVETQAEISQENLFELMEAKIIAALKIADANARRETLRRTIKGVCPECNPLHVLPNGRVWAMCTARKLIGGWTEKELAVVIAEAEKETKP